MANLDPGFAQTGPSKNLDPKFSITGPNKNIDPGMTDGKNLPNGSRSGTTPVPMPSTAPRSPYAPGRPATPPDRGNNLNRVANVIGKVGDYLGNIKRSAQDVPTALGTALDTRGAMSTGSNGNNDPKAPIKNLATQIGQVGGAVFGKTDYNRSDQYVGPNKIYKDNILQPKTAKKPR
jgi:hypothetical protein